MTDSSPPLDSLRSFPSGPLLLAVAASAGAGLVHAAAAGSHAGDASLQWTFAVVAVAQVAWAALVLARPTRSLLVLGLALNAAALVAWIASRTFGLVGPLAEVEPVGVQDLLAAILATVAVAATVATLAPRVVGRALGARAAAVGVLGVLALAVPAMAADHAHGPSHEHEHPATPIAAGEEGERDHDHASGTEEAHDHANAAATGAPTTVAAGPIVSIDDPRLSGVQQRRATRLLDETREGMAAFPDEAAVVAAGYRSIGDGRRPGAFEHFVRAEYLSDGRELDPDAIESIVRRHEADGSKTVASAMFILETGSTMADVPDIAGELTIFHDHQNLCWDETGTRLAGTLVDGQCRPGGTLRPTPPMLHVWVEDTPCGPFTGIEGHGGGCEHDH